MLKKVINRLTAKHQGNGCERVTLKDGRDEEDVEKKKKRKKKKSWAGGRGFKLK